MTNLETESAPLPPPTPPAAPPHERRWARSDDRIVLGVAGGLGRALAVDPLLVRIAFVVLALFSGVGVLLYVACFALLADSPISPPPSTIRRVGGSFAALLFVRWVFNGDAELPGAGWVVAIGLLGAAVALWRGRSPAGMTFAPPARDAPAAPHVGSTTDRWDTWTAQRRERPRPPRSVLGMLTIGAATVVGSTVWLVDGSSSNRGTHAFGAATVVLGFGLVVGTLAGRARWLIVPAVGTAVAAVAASALSFAGVGVTARHGDRSEYVGPGSTVAAHYNHGVGNFQLWLSDYPSNVSTSVDVGVGDLTVVVPDGARLQIDARVGVGSIDAFGSSRNGYRRTLNLDTNTGDQLVTLKLRVGIGAIEVRRASFVDGILPIVATSAVLPDVPEIRALQFFDDGTVLFVDGAIDFGDGRRLEADGTTSVAIVEQLSDGSVRLDNGALIRGDGTVVSPGGFVIPRPMAPTPPTPTVLLTPTGPTITATTEVQP